jgi:tRNA (mo5U34)-methyltransferase
MAMYPGRELNNDPTNWWGPNPAAICGMLESLEFQDVKTVTRLPNAAHRAARAAYHALKGKNSLPEAFRQDRAVFHGRKAAQKKGPAS